MVIYFRLQTLILNDTQISSIQFPDVKLSDKTESFKSLVSLSVMNNNITEVSIRKQTKLSVLHIYSIQLFISYSNT